MAETPPQIEKKRRGQKSLVWLVLAAAGAEGFSFHLLQYAFLNDSSLAGAPIIDLPVFCGAGAVLLVWFLQIRWKCSREDIQRTQAVTVSAKAWFPVLLLWIPVLQWLGGAEKSSVYWYFGFMMTNAISMGAALSPILQVCTKRPTIILWSAVAAFTIIFSWICFHLYWHLQWGYPDSGFYAEAFQQTLRGRFMHNNTWTFANLLGDHFSPIVLLLLPFYALFPRHETLMVLHAAGIALAAVPIYLIGRKATPASAYTGLALALAWLFYPPVQMQVTNHTYGMKMPSFAMAFILWAAYFVLVKKRIGTIGFCLLALCCEESVAPVVAMFGLGLFFYGDRKAGAGIFAGTLIWFSAATQWIMPAIRGSEILQTGLFYDHMGKTMLEVIMYMISHPVKTALMVFRYPVIFFLMHLILPLILSPLIRWRYLAIVLPTFILLCTSKQPAFVDYEFQYKATLLPILFLACLSAVSAPPEWLKGKLKDWLGVTDETPALASIVFFGCAISCIFFGNLPFSWGKPGIGQHQRAVSPVVEKVKQLVPLETDVFATERLASHLTDRRNLYRFQAIGRSEFDYAVFDFLSDWPPLREVYELRRELVQGEFVPILVEEGIVVLEEGGSMPPELNRFGKTSDAPPRMKIEFDEIIRAGIGQAAISDSEIRILVVWEAVSRPPHDYTVEVELVTPDGLIGKRFDLCGGIWPSSLWKPGKRYGDEFLFQVSPTEIQGIQMRLMPPHYVKDGKVISGRF
jgi:uncharacterized membrane protein